MSTTVRIRLNGEPRDVPAGRTVLGLLEDLGVGPTRVAVERNLDVIRRERWSEVALAEGDVVEVVSFVGGG